MNAFFAGIAHFFALTEALIEHNKLASELIFTAAVMTMPEPGSPPSLKTVYAWFYDAAHQFWNLRNSRNPTQPETPAQPERK